jgi:dTDP-4-amino-4,6-dideoxygalactose transaminase
LSSLIALEIGPGDEVITSPFTFVSSAEVILRVGANPVFADVCPRCLCLDPASVMDRLGPNTKAVMPIHLYGDLGHIRELKELTYRQGVHLIEDACQAFGSRLDSHKAGTFGHVGCFSFFPTKTLGGLGDAGLLCTDDEALATRLRSIRSHGRSDKYLFSELGGNFRMDALHAALLGVLLDKVDAWIGSRTEVALQYTKMLSGLPGVTTPSTCSGCDSAWNAYTIRVPRHRNELVQHLTSAGIEIGLYYPVTLADQELFANQRHSTASLGEARSAAREVASLPIYPGMPREDQALVVQRIHEYVRVNDTSTSNAHLP